MAYNDLAGKTFVVTGGTGLIGSAICNSIIDAGGLAISLDILKSSPKRYKSFDVDCTCAEDLSLAINRIDSEFGRINGAVHSAYPRTADWGNSFESMNYNSLYSNITMQLGSAIVFSQIMFKYFVTAGSGTFVHISSIQGLSAPKFEHYDGTGMTSPVEYSAVKSGIISATKWLAKYSFNKNIRFNCVSPGGVRNAQSKLFLDRYRDSCSSVGMLEPNDVSSAVLFLLSDVSRCVAGQNIVVDDGWSL